MRTIPRLAVFLLTLAASPAFAAAYTFRSVGTVDSAGGGAPVTPGAPAGRQSGDLLLICTATRNASQTLASITGWTELASVNTTGTSIAILGRLADGTSTDLPSPDWTGSSKSYAWMEAYSGDVYTDMATIVHASNSEQGSTSSNLRVPTVTVTIADTMLYACSFKLKTAISDDATTVTTTSGTPSLTKRKQNIPSGTEMIGASASAQETTATDYSGSDFTRDGTDETSNSGGILLSLKTQSSTPPTFTSAPAIGTRTTSSIPVNFTSDQTGTVHGVAVTDGTAAPTCNQIDNETASGSYKYFHAAVTASVAGSGTFSTYTDGTVRDGYFCIEQGTSNYSTVASIADMYKIPAFTTLLTIASTTASTYVSNVKVLDGPGTCHLVSVYAGAAAPTVAQVNAGTGGGIINDTSDTSCEAGTMTLTVTASPAPPTHDLYYSGVYGGQVEAAVHALTNQYLSPPTGKQFMELVSVYDAPGGVAGDSPLLGQSPTVVATDVWVVDTVTATTSYPITLYNNGRYSIVVAGNPDRQQFTHDVWDRSLNAYYGAGTTYVNNKPPNPIVLPTCFDNSVYVKGADPNTSFAPCVEDKEGDAITYSVVSGSLPANYSLNGSSGALTGGSPGACGQSPFTIRYTDALGDYTDQDNLIDVGDTLGNLAGMTEAAAIAAVTALCGHH